MSLSDFSRELYQTAFSTAIRGTDALIPAIQSVHIVALSLLFGVVLVMETRLLGLLAKDLTPASVVKRHLPWFWAAVAVLVVTGLLMTIAEPNRVLTNSIFGTKMALLAVGIILTVMVKKPLLKDSSQRQDITDSASTKLLAAGTIFLWLVIMWCGRWIAYAGN